MRGVWRARLRGRDRNIAVERHADQRARRDIHHIGFARIRPSAGENNPDDLQKTQGLHLANVFLSINWRGGLFRQLDNLASRGRPGFDRLNFGKRTKGSADLSFRSAASLFTGNKVPRTLDTRFALPLLVLGYPPQAAPAARTKLKTCRKHKSCTLRMSSYQ